MLKARRFDVDLAHPPATARRAWVMLGLGCSVLAAVAVEAYRVHELRSVAVRERAAAIASVERLSRPLAASAGRAGKRDAPAMRTSLSEARQVARQLHRPWMELLDGLDRTADSQVRLRQMSVDARFEQLSIEVEAASMREVLGYAQRLANARQVKQARLVSFEQRGDAERRLVARLSATLEPAVLAPPASREALAPAPVQTAQTPALPRNTP